MPAWLQSVLLVLYAAASVALALFARRQLRLGIDWSDPAMRAPAFVQTPRLIGGTGAVGAAEAATTSILGNASPTLVLIFVMLIAAALGGCVGGGVLPALVGGIGHADMIGRVALAAATLAWGYIGARVAIPIMALALGLLPFILAIGVIVCAVLAVYSSMYMSAPDMTGGRTWSARVGARVDYNLCVAGTSLISLGSGFEVDRRCADRVVNASPAEGHFAAVYSCRGAKRIAATIDVRPFGKFQDSMKIAELQYSDRPEEAFPLGIFSGNFYPTAVAGEFRADGLAWSQKPDRTAALPRQASIAAQSDGRLLVRLGSGCTDMMAIRCQAAASNQLPSCRDEFAKLGVNIYRPKNLKELAKWIEDGRAREALAR